MRKLRKPASILTINRTGTGQHRAICPQFCNPRATYSPTPKWHTPPTPLSMGPILEMHPGDKRELCWQTRSCAERRGRRPSSRGWNPNSTTLFIGGLVTLAVRRLAMRMVWRASFQTSSPFPGRPRIRACDRYRMTSQGCRKTLSGISRPRYP